MTSRAASLSAWFDDGFGSYSGRFHRWMRMARMGGERKLDARVRVTALFDDPLGAVEEGLRQREAKRKSGL